ncbi:MAG TPA: flagellar hook-basal body complex protein [Ureibacillus sp.]|nr:flagellar hook-basal body complex protein [Ureibacillus sp.]
MLRSMYSGISGLKNFQTKLDVIGNNISNVNTYGFKKGRVVFKDLISQTTAGASGPSGARGGVNPMQVGLGSSIAVIDTIHGTGALQSTSRSLDLAISGDGFFQVADATNGQNGYTNISYTRAGNFYMDEAGYLVNSDGKYLVGKFATISTQPIMEAQFSQPTATDQTDYYAGYSYFKNSNGQNITAANATATPQIEGLRFDSAGKLYTGAKPAAPALPTPLNATISGDNSYEFEFNVTTGNLYLNNGTARFLVVNDNTVLNEETGQQIAYTSSTNNVYTAVNGTKIQTGERDVYSSVGSDLNYRPLQIPTTAQSISIGQDGTVNFVDQYGELQWAGQIQLAKFSNTGGLEKVGSVYYQATANSGQPVLGWATEFGIGSIQSGFLEMSNVDLSEEFTDMIVAQRGFQANSRIITTSDEILQELVNLKR